MSDAEIARLREYLLRGGFLVVDDFWGAEQWEVFRETMERVLPNQPITDIAESDPVMHVLYDIGEKDRTFIPGTRHLRRGPGGSVEVQQPEGTAPAWRAIYDDRQPHGGGGQLQHRRRRRLGVRRLAVLSRAMTALAYRYGINYMVYSMTH